MAAPFGGEGLIDGGELLVDSADRPSFIQLENAKVSEIIAAAREIVFLILVAFNRNPILVAMRLATQLSCVEPQLVIAGLNLAGNMNLRKNARQIGAFKYNAARVSNLSRRS